MLQAVARYPCLISRYAHVDYYLPLLSTSADRRTWATPGLLSLATQVGNEIGRANRRGRGIPLALLVATLPYLLYTGHHLECMQSLKECS